MQISLGEQAACPKLRNISRLLLSFLCQQKVPIPEIIYAISIIRVPNDIHFSLKPNKNLLYSLLQIHQLDQILCNRTKFLDGQLCSTSKFEEFAKYFELNQLRVIELNLPKQTESQMVNYQIELSSQFYSQIQERLKVIFQELEVQNMVAYLETIPSISGGKQVVETLVKFRNSIVPNPPQLIQQQQQIENKQERSNLTSILIGRWLLQYLFEKSIPYPEIISGIEIKQRKSAQKNDYVLYFNPNRQLAQKIIREFSIPVSTSLQILHIKQKQQLTYLVYQMKQIYFKKEMLKLRLQAVYSQQNTQKFLGELLQMNFSNGKYQKQLNVVQEILGTINQIICNLNKVNGNEEVQEFEIVI